MDFSVKAESFEQKMRIEINSYKQRNDTFWEEMLTHIRQVDKWM